MFRPNANEFQFSIGPEMIGLSAHTGGIAARLEGSPGLTEEENFCVCTSVSRNVYVAT
jgi:hypothetical protein